MFSKCVAACAASLLLNCSLVQPSHAQECKLTELASIDLVESPVGGLVVPVRIDGVPEKLWLDMEDTFSFLALDIGTRLKLSQIDLPHPDTGVRLGGEQEKRLNFYGKIRAFAIPTLEVGSLTAHDVHMYAPDPGPGMVTDSDVTVGGIGLDFLANYDVEIDTVKNKLNLFDPHHCAGQVVYWTHQPVGIIEMQPMPGGTYHYNFELDGKTINAFITPDDSETRLALPVGRETFALTTSSPGVTPAPSALHGDDYRYPFKALSADGLAITNPAVFLSGGENTKVCDGELHQSVYHSDYRCRGDAAMRVGLHELRALHLFFAFSERRLYVTAASAN